MLTLKILFWLCAALVVYTYVGYGAVLWLVLRVKRMFVRPDDPPMPTDDELPQMTLMICAYNEEAVIREKMENIRALDYPREKLCVMWVTDGSTDCTNDLLREYADEVTLIFSPERRGKAVAMDHGLSVNTAPFVVFTDANTMLNAQALREIARQFRKPNVSCVAGEKRVGGGAGGGSGSAARGEGLYWRYESALKQMDSDLYSAMGAAGELFAVRMEHYRRPPQNALLDDFMMSMLMVRDGHRIAYTSQAYATEGGSPNLHEESKRKRRISAGGLQSSWWLRDLMNPFRHPLVAFQFVSHRVLRWTVTPLALLALIPLNIALVALGASITYTVALILQVLFYLAALTGWLLNRKGDGQKADSRIARLLNVPSYFLFMNLNVFLGIGYLVTHRHSGTWEKTVRA